LVHLAVGEYGFRLRASAGLPWLESLIAEYGLQGADVHIGAARHLGDGGLVEGEQVGKMLLSQFSGFARLKVASSLGLSEMTILEGRQISKNEAVRRVC
jgi:hypothetical protein